MNALKFSMIWHRFAFLSGFQVKKKGNTLKLENLCQNSTESNSKMLTNVNLCQSADFGKASNQKNLKELSLEELWCLFPIELVEPNNAWAQWFAEIQETLTRELTSFPLKRISHIGSTAIEAIQSKNIVDVLVEIEPGYDLAKVAYALEAQGFIIMTKAQERISLNLGYTSSGYAEKVFHVHLRHKGDNDELYFRDYLNEHPAVAQSYEALKLQLAAQFRHNRDAYTDAKTDFVKQWSERAKALYSGRYA